MSSIRKAKYSDIPDCMRIYYGQVDYEKEHGEITGWNKEIYPTEDFVKLGIDRGEYYVLEDDGVVRACAKINHEANEHYGKINWRYKECDYNKILVIHTLGVDVYFRRNGYGKIFMEFYEEKGRESGCTVLRFDTVATNTPAIAFYTSMGYFESGRITAPSMNGGVQTFVGLEKTVISNEYKE